VAWHLLAITLSAFPSPEGGMNRSAWKDATVQAELARWAGRLRMDPIAFEVKLWDVASTYSQIYGKLLTPVLPYEDLVGSEQSWKMFVAPHRYPTRLQISGRPEGGPWRVLFEESSPTATWRREILRLERLRSAIFRWGWESYASAFGRGCVGLARLAFQDEPDLDEVRCRMWKAGSPSPEQARAGERPPGRWVSSRTVERGADGEPKLTSRVVSHGPGDDDPPERARVASDWR
jgi:hypothetical protein